MCTLLANGLSGLSPYLCPVQLIGGSLGQSARGNHGNRAPRRLCMDPDARPSSRTPRKPCLARPMPCRHVGECLFLANALSDRWMIGAMGNITLVRISKLTIVWLWHQLLFWNVKYHGCRKQVCLGYLPRIWKLTSQVNKFRLFTVIDSGQLVLNKVILTGGDVEKVIGSELSWEEAQFTFQGHRRR